MECGLMEWQRVIVISQVVCIMKIDFVLHWTKSRKSHVRSRPSWSLFVALFITMSDMAF